MASKNEDLGDLSQASVINKEIEVMHSQSKGDLNWLECCVAIADRRGLDVEFIALILSKPIRDKMMAEASSLRLLKPEYRIPTLF